MRRLEMIQTFDEIRLEQYMLKTWLLFVNFNTPQAFKKPAPYFANIIWFIEISLGALMSQFSYKVVAPLAIHQPQEG